jgi:hypothetical protein
MKGIVLQAPQTFDSKSQWSELLSPSTGVRQLRGIEAVRVQIENKEFTNVLVKGSWGDRILGAMADALITGTAPLSLLWTFSRSGSLTKDQNDDVSAMVDEWLDREIGDLYIAKTKDNEPDNFGDEDAIAALVRERASLQLKVPDVMGFCRHGAFDGATVEDEIMLRQERDYLYLTCGIDIDPTQDPIHAYYDPRWKALARWSAYIRDAYALNWKTEFGVRLKGYKMSDLEFGRNSGRIANYLTGPRFLYGWNVEPEYSFRGRPNRVKGWNEVVAA